jgi:hypothetical protein
VPQVSVLGPILFLLFINDITDGLTCNNRLFADDASLIEQYRNIDDAIIKVSNDLQFIEDWARRWLVTFTP